MLFVSLVVPSSPMYLLLYNFYFLVWFLGGCMSPSATAVIQGLALLHCIVNDQQELCKGLLAYRKSLKKIPSR